MLFLLLIFIIIKLVMNCVKLKVRVGWQFSFICDFNWNSILKCSMFNSQSIQCRFVLFITALLEAYHQWSARGHPLMDIAYVRDKKLGFKLSFTFNIDAVHIRPLTNSDSILQLCWSLTARSTRWLKPLDDESELMNTPCCCPFW